MKTILATLSLALLTAFATPAAADCQTLDATGAFACAFVDPADTENLSVFAAQPGVAGADVSRYEFTFMGMTQRGLNALVYADGASASVSQFCFVGENDECEFQDTTVMVYAEPVGFNMVTLSEAGESRTLCAFTSAGANECRVLS